MDPTSGGRSSSGGPRRERRAGASALFGEGGSLAAGGPDRPPRARATGSAGRSDASAGESRGSAGRDGSASGRAGSAGRPGSGGSPARDSGSGDRSAARERSGAASSRERSGAASREGGRTRSGRETPGSGTATTRSGTATTRSGTATTRSGTAGRPASDRTEPRRPVRRTVVEPPGRTARDVARGAAPTRPPTRRSPRTPPPARPRPPTGPPPARPAGLLVRRARITVCVLSALVVAVTGTAWGLYRDLTAGLTTTNVITGGSSGGGQNILLVGVDSRTDAQGNPLPDDVLRTLRSGAESGVLNSDTIIVLHIPADGGSATAFSIPRDSYVDIPGYRKDKINAAYPATKALAAEELVRSGVPQTEADQQSSATGRTTLIETVQNLTGLTIDHYAEINLLGFYNLTQAIGGVDVCLTAPVDDEFSGARFPAGPQTISGADALAFVRQRHGLPEGDLSRIRRQQVFLAAVADKILSTGTLTHGGTLSALLDVAEKSLVIDSGWDLLGFARQASDIAAGAIDFVTVPTLGGASNERGDVVLVDPAQVQEFIEQRTAPKDEEPEPTGAPAAPTVDPASVTVDVGNGSGGTGLAAQVADRLGGAGYQRGAVENAPSRTTSVVRYAGADGDEAAQAVAAQLGGIGVEQTDGVRSGHVQVLLGTDFAQSAAATAPVATGTGGSATPGPTPTSEVNAGGVPCID
ncbi:LCP family protein [Pseudonocardia sp. RS010]|uniref:LCP family protein n=1 Tax=Pseudonocardia sp. RS010 TaxID=3385979 RepID=UPI0039A266C1